MHGRVPFNAQGFANLLKDSLFDKFKKLTLLIEGAPDRLCRESGLCVCHKPLLQEKTKHYREKLLVAHFSTKHPCPLAGAWAPEYANGEPRKLAEEVLGLIDADVMLIIAEEGRRGMDALSEDGIEVLMSNFRGAKVGMLLYIDIKLDFHQRLPWILNALALVDEDAARAKGAQAIDLFKADPKVIASHATIE